MIASPNRPCKPKTITCYIKLILDPLIYSQKGGSEILNLEGTPKFRRFIWKTKFYFVSSLPCGHQPRMVTIIHLSAAPNPAVGPRSPDSFGLLVWWNLVISWWWCASLDDGLSHHPWLVRMVTIIQKLPIFHLPRTACLYSIFCSILTRGGSEILN